MAWNSHPWNETGGGGGGTIDPSVLQPYIDKCKAEVVKATAQAGLSETSATESKNSETQSKLSAAEALQALDEIRRLIEGFDPGEGNPGEPQPPVDLTKYYTKTEINNLLNEIRNAIEQGGSAGSIDLDDYFTKNEVTKKLNELSAKLDNVVGFELPDALKMIGKDENGNPTWNNLEWPNMEVSDSDLTAVRALLNDLTTGFTTTWSSLKISDEIDSAVRAIQMGAITMDKKEVQFNFLTQVGDPAKTVFTLGEQESALGSLIYAGSLTIVNSSEDKFVTIKIYDYDVEIMSVQINPNETQMYRFNLASHRFKVTANGSGTVYAVFQTN